MLQLLLWFSILSLLSFGGLSAIMPEVQRIVVAEHAWVTAAQFTQLYAVSQASPGPNILIVSLIGWQVSGLAGALVALVSMTLPAGALSCYVAAVWDRFRDQPWRAHVQRALLSVTVGLVAAGGYVLATPHGLAWRTTLIAGASAALFARGKLNPLWLLAGGGVLGYLLF